MDFTTMDTGTVMNGVNSDGVRYLELFLKEYTSVFKEAVNPGCSKCITTYLNKYKMKKSENKNNSGFRLHAKYENIPLEFGSPILVNNQNITEEYAQQLLNRENGKRYFEVIPETVAPAKVEVTRESLATAVTDAKKELDGLATNAHHNTRKAKENAFNKANDALAEFDKKAEAELHAAKTIELEITQEDLDREPALVQEGYVEGVKVLVDAKDYEVNGQITITNIVEVLESEDKE